MMRTEKRVEHDHTPEKAATPLPVFAAVATFASCVSFYIAGGHALFHAPVDPIRTAAINSTATDTHFALSNVSTRIDTGRGSPVFVIRGEVKAVGKGGTVPHLNVRFGDIATGRSVSHIIPRGELLQKGEQISFTTRIPAGTFAGSDPIVTLQGR